MADLFLRFVRDTAEVGHDESRLLPVISRFTFQAFPQATHFVLVTFEPETGNLRPLLARGRDGEIPIVALSTTLVRRVMEEGVTLLYSQHEESPTTSDSIRLSRINAAVCAPLRSRHETIGILQIDIRKPGKGSFGRKDVDQLTVFAHQVALVLDNLRLYWEQRKALESTINALVHSLSLKDPDTALHSERVQQVAVILGRSMGLAGTDLDALSMAAVLHDMGKQGIRDEVLLKPDRLTDDERVEMSKHTELTQNILDKIRYPAFLREVPLYAAYHHEKMDGSGPYGLPGDQIPLASRIISVADVFDALLSARVYKQPMSVEKSLAILEKGKNKEWDPAVVDLLKQEVERILFEVYGRSDSIVEERDGDGERNAA